jgi:large subunit ribosomal protein L10
MAISKAKKEQVLQDLVQKFKEAKSVFFTEYKGLSVAQMADVRSKMKENGVECKVAKKTLIKKAAKEAINLDVSDDMLPGPIGVVFSYEDEVAGPKVVKDLSKDFDALSLTGGILNNEAFGKETAEIYASIPSKDELYAKLVGSIKAPVSGFHGVLHGVMRQFVGTLKAYADTKQ